MNAKHRGSDEGLSLIELVVAVLVSTVVVFGLATLLINSWTTQGKVTTVTQATNQGQFVGSTIERAMRNALSFDVTESGTVLRVRTSLGGQLKCQGFRITSAGAQFVTNATALPFPNTGWASWQSGMAASGSSPFFSRTSAGALTYSFKITTESSPVTFSATVAPRSVQETGSDGCWP